MAKPQQFDPRAAPDLRRWPRAIVLSGILALAWVAGAPAGAAAAGGDYKSRDVGGWTVAASQDGDGCFLTRMYEHAGGTTLLLGVDLDGTNHLSVLNANWSIRPKDRLKLNFRLSNGGYPKHFAIGITSDAKQGFVTSFEPKFPTYFAASQILHVSRGTVPVERLNLDGSGAAVAELRKCVAAQRKRPAPVAGGKVRSDDIPRDPFAPSSTPKSRK